jgi:asparagine synthase (glutamine-hydrolysing)
VNLEGLLSRLDSATMLAGLEARVPYTDHLLVEKMFRLPRKYKIDVAHEERKPYLASGLLEQRGSLRSKRVLRSVAERMMPHSLAHRKKASFPTPVQSWLSGEWQDKIRETLRNSPFGKEVFRPEALNELAENLPQAGMWLWPIVNVLHWGDRQFAA